MPLAKTSMIDRAPTGAAGTPANPFVAALAEEARDAGLRYSSDASPGIRRSMKRGKPVYLHPDGKVVTDQRRSCASNVSPFLRPGRMCGFPHGRTATSRRLAAMR